jgi:MoxR-like ATPase
MSPGREALTRSLEAAGYVPDVGTVTTAHLALSLGRPALFEGEPGVGKTEIANALATVLGRRLIRLQCYEGLDASQALYEWNHARQLLHLKRAEAEGIEEDSLYDNRFLIERPLLAAARAGASCVLLIDEVDRADAAFEAFLLEFLADFAISIPELGRVLAPSPPLVVLTSNRTRELHDALRRRCCYHWIDFPSRQRELRILRARVPGLSEAVAAKIVGALSELRALPLARKPGVAETVDWTRAAGVLAAEGEPWDKALHLSLGLLVKEREDEAVAEPALAGLLGEEKEPPP